MIFKDVNEPSLLVTCMLEVAVSCGLISGIDSGIKDDLSKESLIIARSDCRSLLAVMVSEAELAVDIVLLVKGRIGCIRY